MSINTEFKTCIARKNLLFASLTLFMLLTSLFACVLVPNVKGQNEKSAKPYTTTDAGRAVNTQKLHDPNVTLTPNATLTGKNAQSQISSTKNRYILIGLVLTLIITFLLSFFMDQPNK